MAIHHITLRGAMGGSTQTISNLPSGAYSVTVTSIEGCSGMDDYTIQGTPEIVIDASIDSVTCFSLSDGRIDLDLSGGNPPLDIAWDNGSNSTILNNLPADDYTVTITDDTGCSKEQTFTVHQT